MSNPELGPQQEEQLSPEQKERESLQDTTVVINAGGTGARMASVEGVPKDERGRVVKGLIEYAGRPIIDQHLEQLMDRLGAHDVIVNAGDHRSLVEHLQQSKWGQDPRLRIATTDVQEDTGGDLLKALREEAQKGTVLGDETMVLNVDTLVEVALSDLIKAHMENQEKGAAATIVLTSKKTNIPNPGAYLVGSNGRVLATREADSQYAVTVDPQLVAHEMSSTGVILFNTNELLDYPWKPGEGRLSIYRHMMGRLVQDGKVWAYDNRANFFWEAGTPPKHYPLERHAGRVFEAGKGRLL